MDVVEEKMVEVNDLTQTPSPLKIPNPDTGISKLDSHITQSYNLIIRRLRYEHSFQFKESQIQTRILEGAKGFLRSPWTFTSPQTFSGANLYAFDTRLLQGRIDAS